ncbi:MAG: glycyl-radical enzyme activating protein [Bacteroidales bacterium]|nr:glycyl-radical enzyme activating protein [Bacteroidales bacterium]
MKGLVFNIKRYAIHDGPGIRITFFLKGCPLNCWWCHNPEGISPKPQRVERIDRIGEREFRVTEEVGKYYTAGELLTIAEKERVFMEESGGGVTLSGGEPLMQADFLVESLSLFKDAGMHTTLDTSGYASNSVMNRVMPLTDLFLFDLKHLDSDRHTEFTGVGNEQILENLDLLIREKKKIFLRFPVIPGFNDDSEHLLRVRDFVGGMNRDFVTEMDLLPYHHIGSSKYKRFNMEYRMSGTGQPSGSRMHELKEFFGENGLTVRIGG